MNAETLQRNHRRRRRLYALIRAVLYRPVVYCVGRKRIGTGVTRGVLLVGRYAIKFPRLDWGLCLFLKGWLGNLEEKTKWRAARHLYQPNGTEQNLPCNLLAPVRRCFLLGLVLVMDRCDPCTQEEFSLFDEREKLEGEAYYFSDLHHKNFGWYQGRIVCLDYAD